MLFALKFQEKLLVSLGKPCWALGSPFPGLRGKNSVFQIPGASGDDAPSFCIPWLVPGTKAIDLLWVPIA